MLNIIAAIDNAWGLGKGNALLCHLPADLAHFKSLTMGKPIIMGRKTFESIGKPLPGRTNIVLSHQRIEREGVIWKPTLLSALELAQSYPQAWIIGGASVYIDALPWVDSIYLTHIDGTFSADVFFPKLDASQWHCSSIVKRERCERNPYDLTFCRYERVGVSASCIASE